MNPNLYPYLHPKYPQLRALLRVDAAVGHVLEINVRHSDDPTPIWCYSLVSINQETDILLLGPTVMSPGRYLWSVTSLTEPWTHTSIILVSEQDLQLAA